MTKQRITIVMDNDVVKALRINQAKEIKISEKSVSFSKVVNDTLKKQLRLS